MKMRCRFPELIAGSILALTAAAKITSFFVGRNLLTAPHAFLPGSLGLYVVLGLCLEIGAFVVLLFCGSRAFLKACLGLSVVFIAYHAVQFGLNETGYCGCLGGFLGTWQPLTDAESPLSFVLACGLYLASFVGLFPGKGAATIPPCTRCRRRLIIGTMCCWLMMGGTVLWLWQGRVLDEDEGMEAAKALQLMENPRAIDRMWNDQPPLMSFAGARLFQVFGPKMTVARLGVVAVGLLFALTLAVYGMMSGTYWAGIASVGLLWFMLPWYWPAFILEVPAYCVGISALLPLILKGCKWKPVVVSAVVASAALSIKLTAAFALIVPFVWLFQRSLVRAIIWGCLTVALLVLISTLESGWSWSTIAVAHVNFSAGEAAAFRFDPKVYGEGWLLCALCVASLSIRYARGTLSPIMPWLVAGLVAFLIHLFHRPFWEYYSLHLIVPLAVVAGFGLIDVCHWAGDFGIVVRTSVYAVIAVVCALWTADRMDVVMSRRDEATSTENVVTHAIEALAEGGHKAVFSIDPLWTFSAGEVQTPIELTVVPAKRFWSKQLDSETLAKTLLSCGVDGAVLTQDVMHKTNWVTFLAKYTPVAREGLWVLFVRNELDPKPINVEEPLDELLRQFSF